MRQNIFHCERRLNADLTCRVIEQAKLFFWPPRLRRPDWPWHKIPAARRADIVQNFFNAIGTISAFITTDARISALRWQIPVAKFAIGPEFETSHQRGRTVSPIKNSSTARAAWRPSRIAQTTSDWPRRISPALNTLSIEVL